MLFLINKLKYNWRGRLTIITLLLYLCLHKSYLNWLRLVLSFLKKIKVILICCKSILILKWECHNQLYLSLNKNKILNLALNRCSTPDHPWWQMLMKSHSLVVSIYCFRSKKIGLNYTLRNPRFLMISSRSRIWEKSLKS